MANMLSVERFVERLWQQKTGICLDEKQRKFLELARARGICIEMTQEAKNDPEFQELTRLLATMHQNGLIPHFQIVDVV